jgi:hypothetical protein
MVDFDERERVGALTIDKVSFLDTHHSISSAIHQNKIPQFCYACLVIESSCEKFFR